MAKIPVWRLAWRLLRTQLSLPRFDLFLQGTLLLITLFGTHTSLMFRIAAKANQLPSETLDWVQTGVAALEAVMAPLIGWWGIRHRPRMLSAWLAILAVCGLLVLITTQENYEAPTVVLCNNETISSNLPIRTDEMEKDIPQWVRPALLILVAVFCGLARLAVWTIGFTYLDEHEPTNGAYFFGILVSIRVSVGVAAESWLTAAAATAPGWWQAQLSISMLLLMFAILFVLFPDPMPGFPVGSRTKNHHIPGLSGSLLRAVKTQSLVAQTLGLMLITTALWGYTMHEKSYLQATYQTPLAPLWEDSLNTRIASEILRSFVIIFFITIFRARFSGRRADGVKSGTAAKVGGILAAFAAVVFLVLALLRCVSAPIQGFDQDQYEQPACSSHCQCSSETYGFAPVCALDSFHTYYSPCHAGCRTTRNLHTFILMTECSCASGIVSSENAGLAVRGACDAPDCSGIFAVYQVLYVVALAFSGASMLMQGMGIVRAVHVRDRPVALGAALAFVSLIAYIPGRYLYLFISDSWCTWRGGDGCLLQHEGLGAAMGGTSSGLALASAVFSLAAFLLDRRKRNACLRVSVNLR